MFCPLFTLGSIAKTGDGQKVIDECEKEKCAWWVHTDRECAVLVMAAWLVGLVAAADKIVAKTPPARE